MQLMTPEIHCAVPPLYTPDGVGSGGVASVNWFTLCNGESCRQRRIMMPDKGKPIDLLVDDRELAAILAALRFHQDEDLQAAGSIPDQAVRDIATNGGEVQPLDYDEIDDLCQRLNCGEDRPVAKGLVIEPPHKEGGDEPLFRVVYVIDVNAANPIDAARDAHRIMAHPESQPPALEVIDHRGHTASVDLSEKAPD